LGLGGTLCAAALLLSCGGYGEGEYDPPPAGIFQISVRMPLATGMAAHGGTLFSIVSADGAVRATAGFSKTWNSYCASHPLQVNFFLSDAGQFPLTTERLSKPDPALKTAYAFSAENTLIVVDRANARQFRKASGPSSASADVVWEEVPREQYVNCPPFTLDGWVYPQVGNAVRACRQTGEGDLICDEMAIRDGTFPYVFGDALGNVVTVTNWGDVLIHGPGGWCRAADDGEGFACPPAGAPPAPQPEEPRGFQFYSSIKYRGETLLGRVPEGQLYRFDGMRLALYEDSPPLPAGGNTDAAEAQSMANYCGDLYVGYWPRGEVWVRSLHGGTWSKLGRMFTHPQTPEPAIPYLGNEPEGTPWAFLGQRISSLVLQDERLYLTTSNLSGWHAEAPALEFLSQEQIDEYGAVHALHRPGCVTAQLDEHGGERLYFDFEPSRISIYQGRRLLAEIPNPGFMPSPQDLIVGSSPVFGEAVATVLSKF
jgi:hypothetical protein